MVQRIFRDYIAGRGDKAIAHELNREDIPCPSAHRPEQNPAPIPRRLASQHCPPAPN
ncbi:recombinase family protein [Nocardia amamiensis]|uniref:recombinase family protein n=1 Tax=Nocardia amamiensis TaxID=404578 RepID=UPI0034DCE13B